MTQQMNQYPDFIVIKPAPNIDIGVMAGEVLDRRKTPHLDVAVSLYGCKLEPTNDFVVSDDGSIAQVFLIKKV